MAKKYKSVMSKKDQEKLEFLYKAGKSICDLAEIFTLHADTIIKEVMIQGIFVKCEYSGCEFETMDPNHLTWVESLDKHVCEKCLPKALDLKESSVVKMPKKFTESKSVEMKVEKETFYKTLEVKMTDDEIRIKGQELARAEAEKSRIENEINVYKAVRKEPIETQKAEIQKLSKQINSGTEPREIECYWKYNHPRDGFKTLMTLTENKEVEEVTMTEEEAEDLFINGEGK